MHHGSVPATPSCPSLLPVTIVHADDALVAIDKPASLLSVPGRGADKADCAVARVQAQFADAQTVHRLDMATSGLLLFARGTAVQRALSVMFESREVVKHYEAVVHGLVTQDTGEIDLPLLADWPQRPRQKVDRLQGKPSLTRFRVLHRDVATGTTRLALQPLTGRTHQLRVHLLAIGHPIAGDTLYATRDAPTAARLMLHATRLELRHPVTSQALVLTCAVPF
ncbi:MAG: RNA pseudouridine synthase [Burkholderiales bacterium PBB1]|nr:MAG: RNA pseudouridine synthase [Burkholderiales bacterium PBB1]